METQIEANSTIKESLDYEKKPENSDIISSERTTPLLSTDSSKNVASLFNFIPDVQKLSNNSK